MSVFDDPDFDAHEHVSFFAEPSAGLRAIVAIHRTGPLGTAGGGCRLWPYAGAREAVRDALRLSRAMTYKLALVELPAGGAKAVVIGAPAPEARAPLFEALGRAVDRLGGRFIVSEDVGTTPDDMAIVARTTPWVARHAGAPPDTAASTAYGVLVGLRAAVARRLGRSALAGLRVAVQGLGQVGATLCRLLADAGARLWVTDLDPAAVARVTGALGAVAVAPGAIFDQEVDVLAPCALADALDARTVPRLRCAVVAGSANNQLADPALADVLAARRILYAPDIAISAGGALAAANLGGDPAALRARLDRLGPLLDGIFARAEREGTSTHVAAERTARERFEAMGGRP